MLHVQYRTFARGDRLQDVSIAHSMGLSLFNWFDTNLRPIYSEQMRTLTPEIGTRFVVAVDVVFRLRRG